MNYIKILILIFFLISNISARDHMFPFDIKNIEKIYKLSNGNIVFIEQYERGDRIWELDKGTGNVIKLSFVWSFMALASIFGMLKTRESRRDRRVMIAGNTGLPRKKIFFPIT